jgi:hypothetical protein
MTKSLSLADSKLSFLWEEAFASFSLYLEAYLWKQLAISEIKWLFYSFISLCYFFSGYTSLVPSSSLSSCLGLRKMGCFFGSNERFPIIFCYLGCSYYNFSNFSIPPNDFYISWSYRPSLLRYLKGRLLRLVNATSFFGFKYRALMYYFNASSILPLIRRMFPRQMYGASYF